MRTMIIILGGFLLEIVLPVWLVAVLVNMSIGVARAGYSVREAFPIFLLTFAVPAAAAGFVGWRFS